MLLPRKTYINTHNFHRIASLVTEVNYGPTCPASVYGVSWHTWRGKMALANFHRRVCIIWFTIRAVAVQRSSSELLFANKTKMFFRAKSKRRKITGPWNIGHCDLNLFWGKGNITLIHLSKSMTFIHQILFKIKGKITRPWKICCCDLHFLGQRWHQYDSLSHSMVVIHQILFKI